VSSGAAIPEIRAVYVAFTGFSGSDAPILMKADSLSAGRRRIAGGISESVRMHRAARIAVADGLGNPSYVHRAAAPASVERSTALSLCIDSGKGTPCGGSNCRRTGSTVCGGGADREARG
jgi:hypothetical protein